MQERNPFGQPARQQAHHKWLIVVNKNQPFLHPQMIIVHRVRDVAVICTSSHMNQPVPSLAKFCVAMDNYAHKRITFLCITQVLHLLE